VVWYHNTILTRLLLGFVAATVFQAFCEFCDVYAFQQFNLHRIKAEQKYRVFLRSPLVSASEAQIETFERSRQIAIQLVGEIDAPDVPFFPCVLYVL